MSITLPVRPATTCIEEFRWFVWRQRPCTATLATKSLVGLSEDNEQYQKKINFPILLVHDPQLDFILRTVGTDFFNNRTGRTEPFLK